MYIMNAVIEAIDDQNEPVSIKAPFVEIDEKSGTVVTYSKITPQFRPINGKEDKEDQKTLYLINKVPCTIYRNLKRITTVSGISKTWKYIRFKNS